MVDRETKGLVSWKLFIPLIGAICALGLWLINGLNQDISKVEASQIDLRKQYYADIQNINLKADAILKYQVDLDKSLAEHKIITEGKK